VAATDDLFPSLSQRQRPEEVAEMVRQALDGMLTREEARILDLAARGAHSRQSGGYSSMSVGFLVPVGLASQVRTARDLFPTVPAPDDAACGDRGVLTPYVAETSATIARSPGENSFKEDRLDRAGRAAVGLGELSKRQYNKRFRLLIRMEAKLATLELEIRKREYALVSKSRLASRLTRDEFADDLDTACFIAYLTARANLRSVFTDGPQQRAYDEIAGMLFERCRRNPATNWWAVAHIHPDPEVLSRLTDEQKGRFLAIWFGLLGGIAGLLRTVWEKSKFDRRTMIVRRGDDSTTWNATAGAWNKAREGWVAVLHAMGIEEMIDRFCPGKAMRLMAADVAAWHRRSGGGLEPDTEVWADLPAPWEVLDGSAACTRAEVEAVCRTHGVDPVRKGWTAPRPTRVVEVYRPTPELVHGVQVGHPGLALFLRKMGFFSGKASKLPMP